MNEERRKSERRVPPAVVELAVEERQQLLEKIADQAREIERLKAGQESLILVRDDYKRQAGEYRTLWSKAVVKPRPHGLVLPERDDVIRKAVGMCNRIPGSTTWNAAEYAYDEFVARLNSSPVSAGGVDERAAKGSRKALGAVNAKLKAKVGRLEREISGLKGRHSEKDYREGFESWGRREGVALWPNPKNPETYYCGAAQKAAEAFKAGAEWKACAATPASSADDMADRFISWPLPDSVRPDPCAMNPEYPHRYGTNLMTWAQAKAMFEYVLSAPSAGSGD